MDSRNFWAGGPAYEYCIDHGHVDPTVLLLFYETIFQNLPGHRGRLGLGSMSLEELTQVIDAARAEARRKIVELEETIG